MANAAYKVAEGNNKGEIKMSYAKATSYYEKKVIAGANARAEHFRVRAVKLSAVGRTAVNNTISGRCTELVAWCLKLAHEARMIRYNLARAAGRQEI